MDHGPGNRLLPFTIRESNATSPLDNRILTALSNPTAGIVIVLSPRTKG